MLTAHELKEQGNKLFAAGKLKDAATAYTKAISKNDRVAAYYTNRALCYLKAGDWEAVMQDCRKAIELESNSVKGHVFLGQALIELNLFDDAVNCLQRADALAKEQQVYFGDEIAQLVRVAKKRKFLKEEARQIREETELQKYLIALIHDETQRRIENEISSLQNNVSSSAQQSSSGANNLVDVSKQQHGANLDINEMDVSKQTPSGGAPAATIGSNTITNEQQAVDLSGDTDDMRAIRERLENEAKRRIRQVDELFARVEEMRRRRDVPDYLCGKISFELLRDPVITPSGITYDRRDIEEHLNRVGHFDPVTRAPLTHEQLIANLAMKEVVDNFLEDNPWAVDY